MFHYENSLKFTCFLSRSLLAKIAFHFVLLLFFLLAGKSFALETGDIPGMVSWNCIDFRVIGVCVKPPGIPGIVIMYWEPALLVETVKRPGDTMIESLRPVIADSAEQGAKSLISAAGQPAVPVSSGSGSAKLSGINLQFNEAHVYEFPLREEIMSFIDTECPDELSTGSFVKYLSELDSLEWRIGAVEALHPKSAASAASGLTCSVTGAFLDDLCMGFWGPTYPRRGFITHQSEVVGSAVAVVRAVSISSLLGSTAHIVLENTGFVPSFESDKLELIYPVQSGCIKIGQNPISWESGKLSFSGKYLWVYWRRRICCVY